MINKIPKKVYCINDYYSDTKQYKFNFKKGKIYNVSISDNPIDMTPISIVDDNGNKKNFHYRSVFYTDLFKKYFLTYNEYRRKKLIYLNHIQE
jgi:hypothetical protein